MRCIGISIVCTLLCGSVFCDEVKTPFSFTKIGEVKPKGWLLDRAKAAKDGYTGHMDDVSIHFRRAWSEEWKPRGKALNWTNQEKGSWSSEGGAYWFDGLIRLAWQLDDPELKALAKKRLEPKLANMHENSLGFLWWMDKRDNAQLKEYMNEGNWQSFWLLGMKVKTVAAFLEATNDERAKRAIVWAIANEELAKNDRAKHSASLVSGSVLAWQITKDERVKKCAELFIKEFLSSSQFVNPPSPFLTETLALTRKRYWPTIKMPSRHGVYACEQLLSVWKAWEMTGNNALREAVIAWYDFFDKYCSQPYGVTMMDEEWGWAGAKRGTETCDVAAEIFTRINILKGTALGKWGDDIERAQFNAAPACVSRDFKKHVYTQIPNRAGIWGEAKKMSCSHDSQCQYRESKQWPLCCVAALNKILPNYIQAMWMKTQDGGVVATLYGPSTFETTIKGGKVAFTQKTSYPFSETIDIFVDESPNKSFPLLLRIPGWCNKPVLTINNKRVKFKNENGFTRIERVWKKGDVVKLIFPMVPTVKKVRDMNDNGKIYAVVSYGPLLMSYAYPHTDDNTIIGNAAEPVLDVSSISRATVYRKAMPKVWDWPLDAPIKVVVEDSYARPLPLIPYGCTKLRVSMFPVSSQIND